MFLFCQSELQAELLPPLFIVAQEKKTKKQNQTNQKAWKRRAAQRSVHTRLFSPRTCGSCKLDSLLLPTRWRACEPVCACVFVRRPKHESLPSTHAAVNHSFLQGIRSVSAPSSLFHALPPCVLMRGLGKCLEMCEEGGWTGAGWLAGWGEEDEEKEEEVETGGKRGGGVD